MKDNNGFRCRWKEAAARSSASFALLFAATLPGCGGSRTDAAPEMDASATPEMDASATPEMDASATPEMDASATPEMDGAPGDSGTPSSPHVLLIIADDFGIDAFAPYAKPGDDRTYAATPTIEAICNRGVRFVNAWSAPTCTPTRGTILTGRYGFRTGLVTVGRDIAIGLDERTLPRLLSAGAPHYRHANIGKWHLGTTNTLGGMSAPNTMGWSYYSGAVSGALPDYANWSKVVDGVTTPETRYATTVNVDDALAFIADGSPAQPWLVWMAFNAPHTPFHLPPTGLHSRSDLSGSPEDLVARPAEYYRAMIEALDTEIGRLLENIDLDNTLVLFVGDNGTPSQVVAAPYDSRRAKGTLYEGGVHVPMCASGAGVASPGRTHSALVHTVDLYATMLEATGVALPAENDSVSLWPYLRSASSESQRGWILSEYGEPLGRAIRNDRYKLIVSGTGDEEFYDLAEDPLELNELSAQVSTNAALKQNYEALQAQLAALK